MIKEENGQIIVTELRPMCELQCNESVLLKPRNAIGFVLGRKEMDRLSCVVGFMEEYGVEEFDGWVPNLIYRPDQGNEIFGNVVKLGDKFAGKQITVTRFEYMRAMTAALSIGMGLGFVIGMLLAVLGRLI
jgi:hypothetical protein